MHLSIHVLRFLISSPKGINDAAETTITHQHPIISICATGAAFLVSDAHALPQNE